MFKCIVFLRGFSQLLVMYLPFVPRVGDEISIPHPIYGGSYKIAQVVVTVKEYIGTYEGEIITVCCE